MTNLIQGKDGTVAEETIWSLGSNAVHRLKVAATMLTVENALIVRVASSDGEPFAAVEYLGGHITLHTREYASSGFSIDVANSDVALGEEFELELSISNRGLVILTVNGKQTSRHINWPSHRHANLRFELDGPSAEFDLLNTVIYHGN